MAAGVYDKTRATLISQHVCVACDGTGYVMLHGTPAKGKTGKIYCTCTPIESCFCRRRHNARTDFLILASHLGLCGLQQGGEVMHEYGALLGPDALLRAQGIKLCACGVQLTLACIYVEVELEREGFQQTR